MSKKILVVEDDADIATFERSLLEERGYACVWAKDGVEGLELARKETPDLILLDLMMPRKGGISMFKELKEDPSIRHIPVVVITAVSEVTGVDLRNFIIKEPLRDDKTFVETTGMTQYTTPDAYLEKPIDPDELFKAVKKALKEE